MRISRITLKDFRGFPVEEVFDLAGGRNLLLYGENGSGKSSLYRALVEFFNRDASARSFGYYRNLFSSGAGQSALDGHVTLETDDGASYEWRCLGKRPISDTTLPTAVRERLVDASSRASLLEYRSLLRINLGATDVKERLFDLAVTTLFANTLVTVGGGKEKTVGQLWRELQKSKPYRHTKWQVAGVADAEQAFNDGLRGILPDIERKATQLLGYFTGSGLEVRLRLPGVRYDGSAPRTRDRKFVGLELEFEVKLHGIVVPDWNELLNEARLSSLALSLYLAGAILSNTTPPASAGVPLRLLVLDDVLIGLDLANRMPIIELVEKEFVANGWQVLLLTFDRAWYEVAKQNTASESWLHKELFSVRVGDFEKPLLLTDDDHLYRALAFLEAGQVKAAAVHVRTKFELVLKWACHELGLSVKYDAEPHKVPASAFWSALKGAHYKVARVPVFYHDDRGRLKKWMIPKPEEPPVVSSLLGNRIEHAVSWVLNPLSHSQTIDRYRREIEEAIFAVDELEAAVRRALFPQNQVAVLFLRQMVVASIRGRIATMRQQDISNAAKPT